MGYAFTPYNHLLRKADLASKSNILIDNNGHACLAGFNLLTIIPGEPTITSSVSPKGTPRLVGGTQWSAPEVLKGGAFSKKADIFSFAMVMIEARHRCLTVPPLAHRCLSLIQVFSGTAPFSCTPPLAAMSAITQGRRPPRPTHPGVTGGLWRLIQRCWEEHPPSRPEASEALQILIDWLVSRSPRCSPIYKRGPFSFSDLLARNGRTANERIDSVPQSSSSAQPHTSWRMPPPERSHDPSIFSHHFPQPSERAIRTRRGHGARNGTSRSEPH